MSIWSVKRKTTYLLFFVGIILIIATFIFVSFFYKKPTCFDGKQNQDEAGIDCGGGCEKVCDFQIMPPNVIWARSFKVSDGVYNSIAYIENQNRDVKALSIPYVFKLFDDKNILVREIKGKTNVPAGKIFPVFESGILTGNRIPRFTFFEFTKDIEWQTASEESASEVSLLSYTLSNTDSFPKLEAIIENSSLQDIFDIEVVAIIYDSDGNAFASSRTIIDSIKRESKETAVFTWPEAFLDEAVRVEIFPVLDSYN